MFQDMGRKFVLSRDFILVWRDFLGSRAKFRKSGAEKLGVGRICRDMARKNLIGADIV